VAGPGRIRGSYGLTISEFADGVSLVCLRRCWRTGESLDRKISISGRIVGNQETEERVLVVSVLPVICYVKRLTLFDLLVFHQTFRVDSVWSLETLVVRSMGASTHKNDLLVITRFVQSCELRNLP